LKPSLVLCHNLQMSDINFPIILITAISLSADCFAVALCLCISRQTLSLRQFVRLPLAFGIFQALMMAIGWLAGRRVVDLISAYDHWVVFGLLAIIGGRMIWESFHEKDEDRTEKAFTGWLTLLALSLATSIDSLAVGLSFAFLKVDIVLASGTTGLTAGVITIIGQLIGNRVGALVGKRAEIAGGIILIIIGIRIMIEHML
jgi:manganese efflux pump family protein